MPFSGQFTGFLGVGLHSVFFRRHIHVGRVGRIAQDLFVLTVPFFGTEGRWDASGRKWGGDSEEETVRETVRKTVGKTVRETVGETVECGALVNGVKYTCDFGLGVPFHRGASFGRCQ